MRVTIITPWLNRIDLLPVYEAAVDTADEIIVVDNGSGLGCVDDLRDFAARNPAVKLIENGANQYFARACNQGLAHASGDIVVMLNNDVVGFGLDWIERTRRDVKPDGLYGPSMRTNTAGNMTFTYLEGWCLAARRRTWLELDGFDDFTFQKPYWEDVDLCWRAVYRGYTVQATDWPLVHLGNQTAKNLPDAPKWEDENRQRFAHKVMRHRAIG